MSDPKPEILSGAQISHVQRLVREIEKRILTDVDLRKHAVSEALRALEHCTEHWTPKHLVDVANAIHGFLTVSAVDVGDTVADVKDARQAAG